MPKRIRVPHTFPLGIGQASAFVVQRVIHPLQPFQPTPVEWYCPSDGPWRQDRVPTRGEYLIRPGGRIRMRSVRAILELKPPYLAVVSTDPA